MSAPKPKRSIMSSLPARPDRRIRHRRRALRPSGAGRRPFARSFPDRQPFIPEPTTTPPAPPACSNSPAGRPSSLNKSAAFCSSRSPAKSWACSAASGTSIIPCYPLEKAAAMINMDMIGRVRDGKDLSERHRHRVDVRQADGRREASGARSRSTLPKRPATAPATTRRSPPKASPSCFSSPACTAIITSRATPPTRSIAPTPPSSWTTSPTWSRTWRTTRAPNIIRVAAPDPRAGRLRRRLSGYGPAFGSIPDFNEPPKGVRFADVRDGTPAAKAGLKAGDILIEFDGKEIANLYDFTYALRAHKPGIWYW